jgi:hypothetical protein
MLHVALLAAVVAPSNSPSATAGSSIQRCLATMDGAVYRGDPSDRTTMMARVAACAQGRRSAQRMSISAARAPERVFIIARLLDRAATLSYMGLGDTRSALNEAHEANLYSRVAARLPDQSAEFYTAALANVALTALQLQTLQTDIASANATHTPTVALRPKS